MCRFHRLRDFFRIFAAGLRHLRTPAAAAASPAASGHANARAETASPSRIATASGSASAPLASEQT